MNANNNYSDAYSELTQEPNFNVPGYELLTLCATPSFTLEAMAEYTKDRVDSYQQVVNCVQEFLVVASGIDDELFSTESDLDEYIRSAVSNKITEYGFSAADTLIPLNEGYFKLSDIGFKMVKGSLDVEAPVDLPLELTSYVNGQPDSETGNSITTGDVKNLSLSSMSEQMEDNLTSAIGMFAAIKARSTSTASSLSDKFAEFDSTVSSMRPSSVKINAIVNPFKEQLASQSDDATFLKCISDITNMEAEAEDQFASFDQSTIYEYTGATPSPALDFSTVGVVVNAGAKVVAGLFAGAVAALSSIFSPIVKTVTDITEVNDLYTLDALSPNKTIDKWFICTSRSHSFGGGTEIGRMTYQYVRSKYKQGSSFSYDGVTSESIITIDSFNDSVYSLSYTVRSKLKPISTDGLSSLMTSVAAIFNNHELASSEHSTAARSEIIDVVNNHVSTGILQTDPSKLSEYEAFACYRNSVYLSALILQTASELSDSVMYNETQLGIIYDDSKVLGERYGICDFSKIYRATTNDGYYASYTLLDASAFPITNRDWVQMLAGMFVNESNQVSDLYLGLLRYPADPRCIPPYAMNSGSNYSTYADMLFSAFANRIISPLNYPFFPFSSKRTGFNPCKYAVKTDAQNQDAVTALTTAITTIVVVAALTIATVVILKKATRAAFFKNSQIVGELDNKMWQGEALTKEEQAKYYKAKKKMNRLDLWSSAASGDPADPNPPATDLNPITTLISG